jgi:hypothetical protein
MIGRFLMPLLGAALVAGCATSRDSGPADALAGRTLRMTATNGQVTNLRFRADGSVRATFNRRSLEGRWRVSGRRLCFDWPQARRECWPYRAPFERGRTRTITSSRGNVVRVTAI